MGRISQFKTKLLLTGLYGCLLLVFWYFQIPCVSIRLLGIPCPGCGMTRAMAAALRLDFAAAFGYHPMFWAVPIAYVYFLFDGKLLNKPWADKTVLWLIVGGFLAQWIWKVAEIVGFC